MNEPKHDSYSPERGSSLHDIKRTEELGEIEAEESREANERERLDEDMYMQDEIETRVMDGVHEDRVGLGQVAEAYRDMDSTEVSNAAYADMLARKQAGDERLDDEIKSDFYELVYPEFKAYRERRKTENPEAFPGEILYDFLYRDHTKKRAGDTK
jgi:hypothetical protein